MAFGVSPGESCKDQSTTDRHLRVFLFSSHVQYASARLNRGDEGGWLASCARRGPHLDGHECLNCTTYPTRLAIRSLALGYEPCRVLHLPHWMHDLLDAG